MVEQKKNNKTLTFTIIGLVAVILTLITIYFFQNDPQIKDDSDQTEETTPPENENDGEGNTDEDESDQNELEQDNEPASIEELSGSLLHALDEQNMEDIAPLVHPEKGLTFSPYVYIEEDAIVFDQADVAGILNSDEVFIWGHYDGEGSPIETTSREYFGGFLGMDPFLNADEVLIDDPQERGNTVNNIMDVFPDARIMEYYKDGTDANAGMDWESIIFVYEPDDSGELKLVAIVRDMWTI